MIELAKVETAKVSEIFISFQGEGPYAGSKQLFVRFYGCNRSCIFCDTFLESYKSFTKDSLMGRLLTFQEEYNELVLTGGEPLLYPDFLNSFLILFKTHHKNPVYLETNGTLPQELEKVISNVDIISMDFKLPSSTGGIDGENIWEVHRKFAEIASQKELIIKAVITDTTVIEDIKSMVGVIKGLVSKPEVVLQIVTPVNDKVKEPDAEMLVYFKKYLEKNLENNVMVLGQFHKCIGIK